VSFGRCGQPDQPERQQNSKRLVPDSTLAKASDNQQLNKKQENA
jgi:hypothetical protein